MLQDQGPSEASGFRQKPIELRSLDRTQRRKGNVRCYIPSQLLTHAQETLIWKNDGGNRTSSPGVAPSSGAHSSAKASPTAALPSRNLHEGEAAGVTPTSPSKVWPFIYPPSIVLLMPALDCGCRRSKRRPERCEQARRLCRESGNQW